MWNGNSTVFRGYIHGKVEKSGSTVPSEKVKGEPGHQWSEVINDDSFGALLNKGFVDISFDSDELSTAFWDMAEKNNWNCLILENPVNGHIHSYWRKPDGVFKKDGRDKKLAVGLVADIHSKDTYIRLRTKGVDRFPPCFEPKEIQVVPEELYPVDTNIDLWGMQTGDGRNDELFKYILVLQSKLALSNDTIRRILGNTNNFIFDEPLDEEEFKTITRDEAFNKPTFFRDKTFLFDQFASYLKNICHVVKINNQLHIYKDGVYVTGYREIEQIMIQHIPNLKKTQRREVIDYMELIAEKKIPADANYIAFRNGVYDVAHNKLLPFTPDLTITNRIEWDFNPNAYFELTDLTLNKLACNDKDIRSLLEECIGYCFYRRNELGKAFILTGGKSNGKSTFLDCIKAILGIENISALELKELGDRFSTSMLFGKLANISDDISDDFLQGNQVATFKKVVTGNRIKAERKGQDPFEFEPYIKMIASANDIPRMKDKTGAVLRRLVIIPFNATFSKYLPDGAIDPEYNPWIKYDLVTQESIEYLIAIGIQGLKRVIENNEFTQSEKVQKQLEGYEEENNPILLFLKESERNEIENEPTNEVYKRYTVFCAENSMTPLGNVVFTKQVCKRLGLKVVQKRVHGYKRRVYIPDGDAV